MNYFTLQIHYNVPTSTQWPKGIAIEERKDLNCGTMEEKAWIRSIREKLYSTGFQTQTASGCFEFISPLRIHTAYLLKQDRRYSPDPAT